MCTIECRTWFSRFCLMAPPLWTYGRDYWRTETVQDQRPETYPNTGINQLDDIKELIWVSISSLMRLTNLSTSEGCGINEIVDRCSKWQRDALKIVPVQLTISLVWLFRCCILPKKADIVIFFLPSFTYLTILVSLPFHFPGGHSWIYFSQSS